MLSEDFFLLASCFRKEIPICSMKLEYLSGKRKDYCLSEGGVNTEQRAKMRPVLSHLLRGLISSPCLPLLVYAIPHNNPLSSPFDASLSCRFLRLGLALCILLLGLLAIFNVFFFSHFSCYHSLVSIPSLFIIHIHADASRMIRQNVNSCVGKHRFFIATITVWRGVDTTRYYYICKYILRSIFHRESPMFIFEFIHKCNTRAKFFFLLKRNFLLLEILCFYLLYATRFRS